MHKVNRLKVKHALVSVADHINVDTHTITSIRYKWIKDLKWESKNLYLPTSTTKKIAAYLKTTILAVFFYYYYYYYYSDSSGGSLAYSDWCF